MNTHDTDDADWHDDEESDDWHGEWAQGRIADLEDQLADDDSDHNGQTLVEAASAWWENLLARLWWRWRWIIPLSALLIPFLLLIGGLAVLARFSGDESAPPDATESVLVPSAATTPVQAQWPPGIPFAEHTIPAMIRDDISLVGAMRGYLFSGELGDTWRIEVEPDYGSTLDPVVHLYGPDGHQLATNDNRAPGDPSADLLAILPQDGAYRIVIQAAGEGLTTGEYWLMVSEE